MDEEYQGGMTDTELGLFLGLLADLIEAAAQTPAEAAAMVRERAEILIQAGKKN